MAGRLLLLSVSCFMPFMATQGRCHHTRVNLLHVSRLQLVAFPVAVVGYTLVPLCRYHGGAVYMCGLQPCSGYIVVLVTSVQVSAVGLHVKLVTSSIGTQ